MAITFPQDCDTPAKRTEWLYRAQEKLRLIHNFFGEWHKIGKTQQQYDNLPQKVKNKYSYVPQLSDDSWRQFRIEDFEPRSDKIAMKICENRNLLKASTTWDVNIEDI